MMRRWILLIAIVTAVVGGAAALILTREEAEWTANSPEALAELRAGLQADQRFYRADAVRHYERALELDPDFAFAKIRLLDGAPKMRVHQILDDLRSVDTSALTDRERFFVAMTLARFDGKRDEAAHLTKSYIDQHPHDAWGLFVQCSDQWSRRELPAARQCYQRLLALAPNWVLAQNNLGYIEMAEGRFAEAENAFRTYRYIAPDQANPHDSLGELLTLRGRYEEAERELREAVRIRPDFCDSWNHLMEVELLRGDYDKAARVAEEAAAVAPCAKTVAEMDARARLALWRMADKRDAAGVLALPESGAYRRPDGWIIRHAAAIAVGNLEEALRIEKDATSYFHKPAAAVGNPVVAYLEARRQAARGDHSAAISLLRRADAGMKYGGRGDGVLKLAVKALLGDVLEASGNAAEAEAVRREIDRVNPQFLSRFNGSLLELP